MLESLIALAALSAMEVVLGIDNLVFISILTSKLPVEHQSAGRRLGLALALVMRILLLSMIFFMAQMTSPMITLSDFVNVDTLKEYFKADYEIPAEFQSEGMKAQTASGSQAADASPSAKPPHEEPSHEEPGHSVDKPVHGGAQSQIIRALNVHAWNEFNEVSWRDIILIAGGIFLLIKSVKEIHSEMEGHSDERQANMRRPSFASVLFQIAMMDIIFSLDSVITAVGMADDLWVMIAAVILAVAVMILFANQVGNFVNGNPTIKMLALNFLLIVGVMLIGEGIGTPIGKGYIYSAMAFSLLVEFLNMRVRSASAGLFPAE